MTTPKRRSILAASIFTCFCITKPLLKKKEKRKKMERQNSEVVRFELAPPEFDSNYSQIVRAAIHCATTRT